MATVGAESPVDLAAAPLEPEITRAVHDLVTLGDGQAAGLTELKVGVGKGLAFAEVRGDLQPYVILRIFPEEDAGPVIGTVRIRRGFPAGVAGPRDPHADLELPRDLMNDAWSVHAPDFGAQEVGGAGDEDREPILGPVRKDLAIAVGVDDFAPLRWLLGPLQRLSGPGLLRDLPAVSIVLRRRLAGGFGDRICSGRFANYLFQLGRRSHGFPWRDGSRRVQARTRTGRARTQTRTGLWNHTTGFGRGRGDRNRYRSNRHGRRRTAPAHDDRRRVHSDRQHSRRRDRECEN